MPRERQNPGALSPREAWQRYMDRRRSESTERTMETFYYRLKVFVEWCEQQGIDRVDELDGWIFEQFETDRSGQDLSPLTRNGEMQTIKNWMEYLERIEAVEGGLAEKVHVPQVPAGEESDETQLLPADAITLIEHYRDSPGDYGTRKHALLETYWFTGARMSAVGGLDLRDYHSEDRFVEFVHRPKTDTPLKNKLDGQRPVGIPQGLCDVLDAYVERHRVDISDGADRQPLFTTKVGRLSSTTLRADCYMATFPCRHSPCPHGKDPETCDYKRRSRSSRCPSSRSPHQIRTGSIRWQLDIGIPPEVVAERVNASLKIIQRHYDKATPREKMERRRRRFVDMMEQFDSADRDPQT